MWGKMMKKYKRVLSVLLVFLLVFSDPTIMQVKASGSDVVEVGDSVSGNDILEETTDEVVTDDLLGEDENITSEDDVLEDAENSEEEQ